MAEIKVTDRRSFDSEGEVRAEVTPGAESDAGPEATEQPRDRPEVDFHQLVFSFYQQALLALGLLAQGPASGSPQGEPPEADLATAQYMIDLLEMLQGKTRNNLTPAEDKFLAEVLYELRMVYIHVARSGAKG
ncbi:MAG: DUF1844 domain-containing protein [Acidobacteria bacterium]|nr:DUF1844 domain-containing protein [Acidobacteriota bacterium]